MSTPVATDALGIGDHVTVERRVTHDKCGEVVGASPCGRYVAVRLFGRRGTVKQYAVGEVEPVDYSPLTNDRL